MNITIDGQLNKYFTPSDCESREEKVNSRFANSKEVERTLSLRLKCLTRTYNKNE